MLGAWEPIPGTSTIDRQQETLPYIYLEKKKIRETQSRKWKQLLGFVDCFKVGCKGKSGGLILTWKDPLNVHFLDAIFECLSFSHGMGLHSLMVVSDSLSSVRAVMDLHYTGVSNKADSRTSGRHTCILSYFMQRRY